VNRSFQLLDKPGADRPRERDENMKSVLAAGILVLACAAPAAAAPGMAAMQYYVGSWTCTGGPVGAPPLNATTTYTLDSGLMHQWVTVPRQRQGKMTKPYVISFATTYDAKKRQYVQTSLDSDGAWGVSVAKLWTGNTEQWTDSATSDGKLGHGTGFRTSANAYVYTGYPTATSTKPNFRVSCKRST
jgi:hypothetical protein